MQITLCLTLFPWAEYTRTKDGVKLHRLLDHDGYFPSYAVITDAKRADAQIARTLALPKGSIVRADLVGSDRCLRACATESSRRWVTPCR